MSVHQLKDGRWIVQYRVNKKYKREYYGRGKAAETEARERDALLNHRDYVKRTPGPNTSPLFRELVEGYLAARIASIEQSTYSILKYKLASILIPELGSVEALKFTKDRLDKYVEKRLAQGKKTNTIRRDIADIQAIMNWAVSRELINLNPLSGYKKPRSDAEIIMPPTLKEIIEIDKHAPNHLRRALKIIFYTGARPGGEITSLKWSNVNWDQNTIRIISARKHGLKYRDVPIFREFRTLLEAWKEEDEKRLKAEGKDSRIQGFKGSSGNHKPETINQEPGTINVADTHIITYLGKPVFSLKRSWGRARRLAGITRAITPYSYRHAFVSMLLDSGADLKSVSELVGHSNVNLTLAVYQSTNKAMHRSTIEKLPAMNW